MTCCPWCVALWKHRRHTSCQCICHNNEAGDNEAFEPARGIVLGLLMVLLPWLLVGYLIWKALP